MKIVIQNRKNKLFWKQEAVWTAHLNDAHDFETTTHAQRFCQDHQWNDVQIVLKFQRATDVVLTVK